MERWIQCENIMASSVQVKIYGKTYRIKDGSTSVDPHELADLVNSKMQELSKAKAGPTTTNLAILAALNIAQELMELKKEVTAAQEAMDRKADALANLLSKEIKHLESKRFLSSDKPLDKS